jgi:hypothetical protein
VETTRGRIETDTVVLCAGIWGPKVAQLAGVRLPLVPVQHQYLVTEPLRELAGTDREVVHPILRHQDQRLYFRQVFDSYGIGNYDHEPRLTEPRRSPAPGGRGQPSILPFTPEDFERARLEAREAAPGSRARPDRAPLQRADVLHARRLPAAGTGRGRGRPVARGGDLGHPRGRRRARARRAAGPRRRQDRSARVRPPALRRARAQPVLRSRARRPAVREVYDVIHPRQQSGQVRPLRRTPLYPRQLELGAHFFESAGWERPQWFEANAGTRSGRRAPAPCLARARVVARPRSPSTAPAVSASGSST